MLGIAIASLSWVCGQRLSRRVTMTVYLSPELYVHGQPQHHHRHFHQEVEEGGVEEAQEAGEDGEAQQVPH